MLAGDWVSFSFSYILDMVRLIPHVVALEAHRAAALARTLPPHWLEAPEDPAAAAAGQRSRDTSIASAWVRQRFGPGSAPLSMPDILTIHRLVAEQSGLEGGSAGALRTAAVRVGRPSVGGYHLGAPEDRLPRMMEQYVDFIDSPALSSLPPVIHALLAHFFFDTLHPFLDGNGRSSRLVAAALLARAGYNLHGSFALIRYFYSRERHYHTLLHRAWQRCPFELTPFVAFGIEGFVMELKSVDTFLKMKLNRAIARDSAAPARIGLRRGLASGSRTAE